MKSHDLPQESPAKGCALAGASVALIFVMLSIHFEWWWLSLLGIPPAALILPLLNERFLLHRALRAYRHLGIIGIIVTSDSPKWKD